MVFHMKLQEEPFRQIKNRNKTVELRLFDQKRSGICVGDRIVFSLVTDNRSKLYAVVTALHRFENFEQLYADIPLLKCGYTKENIDSASPCDMEKYYSREQQEKYGVVGIEFVLT